MDNPLITCITVVYNGEKTIENTIKSIINMKKNYNIEYIIIDGGSTDKTINILTQYEDKISFWLSEADKGIYDAMNKGWNIAKDSYILFLGAGDELLKLPRKCFLENKTNNIIYYGNVNIGSLPYFSNMSWKFKVGNTLHHQALLIPKSLWPCDPFELKYKVYADYEFNTRLYKSGLSFIHLDDFEAFALPGGLSSNINVRELLSIIHKKFGFFWALIAIFYHSIQAKTFH
jgi:glycosyltransferase involved in cell wall biosynthesis